MNRIAGAALAALVPVLAGARDVEAGTWQLTGGTQLTYARYSDQASSFRLDTQALEYVVRNVGVGLAASYARETFQSFDGRAFYDTTQEAWIAGPVLNGNVPLGERTAIWTSAAVGLVSLGDEKGQVVLLGGGLRWFASDAVALDAGLQYQHDSIRIDGTVLSFGVGLSVFLGGRSAQTPAAATAAPAAAAPPP